MRCEDCINHMDEKQIEELGDNPANLKIKNQYYAERDIVADHLRRGEKVVFCVWMYAVVGSKSVCADIESLEDVDNE